MTLQPLLSPKTILFLSLGYLVAATPLTGGISAWTEESGAIETLGFYLMLAAPLVFLAHFPPDRWAKLLHVPVVTLLLAKREAESDWWIIDERLLTAAFYAGEGLSIPAVIGGLIALTVIASVFTFFRFGIPALWRGVRQRARWLKILGGGFGLGVAGQLLEELAESLNATGTTLWTITVLEESSEMVFSLCVVLAILAVPLHAAATQDAGVTDG